MIDEAGIRARYLAIKDRLDERGRRLFVAAENAAAGHGGTAAMFRATGVARSTIIHGAKDLAAASAAPVRSQRVRVRRAGAGRPRLSEANPAVLDALRRLVEPATLGDPMRPLLWVSKSREKLAAALRGLGHRGYLLGVAPTSTLRRHVERLEASTAARFAASDGSAKLRRFTEFYDGAASWDRVERIVEPRGSPDTARVEAGPDGIDTRFTVTSLPDGSARALYERRYCQRGQAENHIKAWKTHLAADRTSCTQAAANQFRLFLHAGAYWHLWSLRTLMPRRSAWRTAQFDTLRLHLVKLAVRVVELKTQVKLHLPSRAPCQSILAFVLGRMPRIIS